MGKLQTSLVCGWHASAEEFRVRILMYRSISEMNFNQWKNSNFAKIARKIDRSLGLNHCNKTKKKAIDSCKAQLVRSSSCMNDIANDQKWKDQEAIG